MTLAAPSFAALTLNLDPASLFAPPGERPEARAVRESKARAVCSQCTVLSECRVWARENRE